MKVSVIVPTYNRVKTLQTTLSALSAQTLADDDYEVIVVDDGSDEENRRRLEECRKQYHYRLLENNHGGVASARNLGADHANGDILYFVDDDVVLGVDAVNQHFQTHLEVTEPVAVVGALPFSPIIKPNAFVAYMDERNHFDLYKNPHKYPGGQPPLPPMNGNASVSRELFFEIGKYDESFKQYGGEDLELGYRLSKSGVKFVYNPHAVGYHNHVKSFPQFCADMEKAGESLIQVYRKYPEIKVPKKIDLLEDSLGSFHGRKKIIKLIVMLTLSFPGLLSLPRLITRLGEPYHSLRTVMFPLFQWISDYHYAVGMERRLSETSMSVKGQCH